MKPSLRSLLTFAATAIIAQGAIAQSLVGITQDDKVFTMANIAAPGVTSTPISVTGMTSGQTIVGADYRPLTGDLYILGYNGSTSMAQLYTLNTTTGVAVAVSATPVSLALGNNSSVSFDFNPTVDRIRVIGANKKNYRLNPVDGTITATDGDINFDITDPNSAVLANIGAVAYSNSYVGSNTTTAYAYDMTLNIIASLSIPNNGTLLTIGASGLVVNNITNSIDMDIYMDPITLNNTAYLAANVGAAVNDNLFTVNLSTGVATNIGLIGSGMDVKNIAISLNRTLPAVTGRTIYGIQANTNILLSFDSDNPRLVRSYMPITGMAAGQLVAGLDFRPSTMQLYALGYDYTAGKYQLYTVNTSTAVATAVNTTATSINLGLTNNVAFDFNPVTDRIRVIGRDNGMNYRLNPVDGSIEGTDTAVAYGSADVNAGKSPRIGAIAYTNSYNNATASDLYALDDSLGSMVNIGSPNGGMLSTSVVSLVSVNLSDMTSDIDFFYDSTTSTNMGYISINTSGSINDKLYTVTPTGTLATVSDIGLGISMSDIAVQPQYRNSASVGITNVNAVKPAFTVYPNPATNEIYINVGGTGTEQVLVTIADMTGRVVRTSSLKQGKISIAYLQQGMYFVNLVMDGQVYQTQKLIKQ